MPTLHSSDSTRCLREEHQLILKVLDCFEIALRQAREAGKVTRAVFEPFLEFFRGFADRCHHCKEEDRLFPRLEEKGVPREGGPIGVMLYEHQLGRQHVRAMAEQLDGADRGDAAAARSMLEQGSRFLDLLRNHIGKEDHVLFEIADQLLRGPDELHLAQAYDEAQAQPEYCRTFDHCRRIADELLAQYGAAR